MSFVLFLLLGVLIGGTGTLIGVGGGFLLMPILLWLYPDAKADSLAALSLSMIFFNALSGSIAYARMKRIDYKSGLVFAATGLPGTILGAMISSYIPRGTFDIIIGSLLCALAVYLFFRPERRTASVHTASGRWHVNLTDSGGENHSFSFNPWIGIAISFGVGFLSSILGIGGGVIHVPAMTNLLNFPVHIATATSHFILVIMSCSGSITHFVQGHLTPMIDKLPPLALGVIVGAQIGARFSKKISGRGILRFLAAALLMVGIRTIWAVLR